MVAPTLQACPSESWPWGSWCQLPTIYGDLEKPAKDIPDMRREKVTERKRRECKKGED